MAKPITEHAATVKADKKNEVEFEEVEFEESGGRMQPVSGGRVRRIVFEGRAPVIEEVRSEPGGEKVYHPRHRAPIQDIHKEIDRLGSPAPRADREAPTPHEEAVYTTQRGGEVRTAFIPGRRVHYTTVDKGSHVEDRRFSVTDVDRIIAGVDLEPRVEVVREERTEVRKRRRTVVEKVPVKAAKKPAKKAKPTKKAKKPEVEPEPVFEAVDKEYRPQCAAVTSAGVQCRNSARGGSDYCGSHKGYHPKSLESALAAKDTVPANVKAEDTLPGVSGKKGGDHQPQCAAYTKDGLQCKNSSRKSSKYCGSHKGYRAPSKADLMRRMDTKPRWAKAEDTAPRLK